MEGAGDKQEAPPPTSMQVLEQALLEVSLEERSSVPPQEAGVGTSEPTARPSSLGGSFERLAPEPPRPAAFLSTSVSTTVITDGLPSAAAGVQGGSASHEEGDSFLQLDIIEEALKEIEHPLQTSTNLGEGSSGSASAFNRAFLMSVLQGLQGVDVNSAPVVDAIEQLQAHLPHNVTMEEGSADVPPRRFLQSSLSSLAETLPSLNTLSDDEDDDDIPPLLEDSSDSGGDDLPPLADQHISASHLLRHDSDDDDIPPALLSDESSFSDDDEDEDEDEHIYGDISAFEDNIFHSLLYSQMTNPSASRPHRSQRFSLPLLHSDSERDEETGSSGEEDNGTPTVKTAAKDDTTNEAKSSSEEASHARRASTSTSQSVPHIESQRQDTGTSAIAAGASNTLPSLGGTEVVDFDNLSKYTTEHLERFCEQKGILLKKHQKRRVRDEDEYKSKLIALIQRYREEEEEYEDEGDLQAQLASESMSAEDCKLRANALLTAGQFEAAVRFYTRAINIANRESREKGSETDEERQNKAFYYANRSLAHLKWGNYASSVSDSTIAIQLFPDYPKGYYRRAMALLELHQYRKALDDFKMVLSLKPGDKDAQRQLRKCEQIIRAKGFELPDNTVSERSVPSEVKTTSTRWAPPHWSTLHMPKLFQLAARVLAHEIGEHMELYEESLKDVPAEYMKQIMAHMSWPVFQKLRRIPHYKSLMSNTSKYTLLKQEEDYYRTLFVRERDHPSLDDPNLMLIKPHEDMSLFNFEDFEEEERAVEMVLPICKQTSGSSIVSFPEFLRNFDIFTEGQLRKLNWNNVLVAGGSVLASIMPTPWGDLRGYFHKYAYRSSDIDLFLYGLTPAQANEKLQEIYDAVKACNPKRIAVVRTLHAVTIVSHFPRRHVQIVLRLYKSPAEILMGFDGFDGINVLIHPRCARALKMQYNLADVSRRSRSYEYRLYKYSKRGFAVAVPGFDRSKVKPSFYTTYIRSTSGVMRSSRQGLARLLLFEYIRQNVHWDRTYACRSRARFDSESKRVHEQEHGHRSDYAGVHIPYGPYWDSANILYYCANLLNRINDMWYRLEMCVPPRADIRPLATGHTMQEVLAVTISTDEPEGTSVDTDWEDEPITLTTYRQVGKDDMWVTENPGSQEILFGSFYPTVSSFEEWAKDAYADYDKETYFF